MNILQVTPRYAPSTGGVETHVQAVSERLVERGHEVTVLTADGESGRQSRTVENGVRVERHRGFAPQGAFHVAPAIAPAVRRADVDVVHAHNYHSLPLLFAALGITDERFVVTPHYHGASADALRDRLLSLYRPLGGWALGRTDAVVAVSEWERDRLHADFGVNATVIPNGLDVERFADAEPEARDPYLLCVGRLEAYKGVQHAIRALAELPEYELLVAGDGPYRDELERIARREGVGERVDFLGFVAEDRLPSLYAGATAFVTLSEFEAYGMTVAEALAAGTSCVVYDCAALGDWTSTTGCVGVAGRSPRQLRAAIEQVRDEEPDSRSPWTWDEVVDALEAVYRAE